MGKGFSRDTFLTELKSILQEMPGDYYEEKTVDMDQKYEIF